MNRGAAALLVTILAAAAHGADAAALHVVACRNVVCSTSLPEHAGDAAFAWIWSESAAPVRVGEADLFAGDVALAARLDPRSPRMTFAFRRAATAKPLILIAAPIRMWTEVPEPLLPHYPVPKGGRLNLP